MGGLRTKVSVLGLAGALLAPLGCARPLLTDTAAVVAFPGATAQKDELPAGQAAKASLAVAQNLDKNGSEAAAIEQYEKVQQLQPDNLQAAHRLAVLYDRQCNFPKAEAQYRKLAQARPRDADVFNDWGYSCYLRNQWGEAEKHFNHALVLDPEHQRARANLGLALGQQRRYDEALRTFRTAKLSEAEAHCNLAFIYWSQGKMDDAR